MKEEQKEAGGNGLPKPVFERHKSPRSYTVFGPDGKKVVLKPEFHVRSPFFLHFLPMIHCGLFPVQRLRPKVRGNYVRH